MGLLKIILPLIKYVQIFILGICIGFPVNTIMLVSSVIWSVFNKSTISLAKKKVYDTIERKEIKLDTGITYDYLQTKTSSRKVALFLHGFPDSAFSWSFYMDKLSREGYMCLAPNQRGYGRTSKPTNVEAYDVDILVADVVNFIDKKVQHKVKVTLVIHDWGSAVGYRLARCHPELVKNIIAINGPSLPGMVQTFQKHPLQIFKSYYISFFQLPILPEYLFSLFDYAVYKRVMFKLGTPADELEDALIGFGAREEPNVMTSTINWYRASSARTAQMFMTPETRKIPHDTLMLWGDEDSALSKEFPDIEATFITGKVQIVHFPDASHNLHQQDRKGVWDEMQKFLTE